MPLLLDTTILIDVLRGRSVAARLKDLSAIGERPPWISAISVEEIHRGARPSESEAIKALLDGLQVVPVGRREAETAGVWRRDFAKLGVTLAQSDCLIAASAHVLGIRLATGNVKDYPMPDLMVEHWPVGK